MILAAKPCDAISASETISGIPYDWPNRQFSRLISCNGARWHVQRAGQGPKLLLLHGTAASTHTWRDFIPALSESYDVMAVDLPGHGFTTRLQNGEMSLLAMSRALDELLHLERFAPTSVVSHSAGTAIALQLADSEPSIRQVIGINAALLPFGGAMRMLFSPMAHFFASTRLMPRLLARRARDPRAVKRVLEGTGSRLDAVGLDYYCRLFSREQHIASVLEMMASWDLQPLLARLKERHPALFLITGSNDLAVRPSEAQDLAQRLKNVTVQELDGLGHLAHEEAPDVVLPVLQNMLRQH